MVFNNSSDQPRWNWKAIFERPRPRLHLHANSRKPLNPYKRSAWTLRFAQDRLEQQFVKLHSLQAMGTTRLLAAMLVLIGLGAVASAVFGSVNSPGQAEWYIIVTRVIMTVISLPLVFLTKRIPFVYSQLWTGLAIVLYYFSGFFSIVITTQECIAGRSDNYKNFVGGQFTIFLATAVIAGSGVFLFPVSLAITATGLLISLIFYFTLSGALGNACFGGGCLMTLSYLAYHGILFLLSMANAYRHEARQRQRFALAHRLQMLAEKIAKMDLEAAEAILVSQSAAESKDEEDTGENERLLAIIRHLKLYRPFLPESLFVELSNTQPQPEALTEENSGVVLPLLENGSFRGDPPNTPDPIPAERLPRMELFGVGLREVVGTILVINVDLQKMSPNAIQEMDEAFMEIVMSSAEETEGMVLNFGGGHAVLTWNTHHTHPQHQFTACRCALNVSKRFKRVMSQNISMAVSTGQVLAGITGTDKRKTSVVIGPPMRQAMRLVGLNDLLKTTILVTQSVYEVVQSSFATYIVDFVQPEGDEDETAVHELAGFRVPDRTGDDLYKQAFTEIRQLHHLPALDLLQKYFALLTHQSDPCAVRQAVRLWRTAAYYSEHPVTGVDSYCRKDGWDNVEKEMSSLAMPPHLHSLVAPFLTEEEDDDVEFDAEVPGEFYELEAELAMFDSNKMQQSVSPEKTFEDLAGQTWSLSNQLLGQGGFGAVYLGMSANGKLVAVKAMVIAKENAEDYMNEIKLLIKFRHPNIVGYLGSAIHQSKLMIVMEYVPCGSLDKIIERFRDNLTLSSSRRYLRDILRGIHYLHIHAVVHRDIKPENVLMTAEGECKVADFGTAGTINPEGESIVKGTPHYMAPEVFQGLCSTASDIWSFGVTALQVMTTDTQCPLEILREKTQIMAVMFTLANLTEPPALPANLPAAARSFLTPCFAIDPAARPTAAGLLSHPLCL